MTIWNLITHTSATYKYMIYDRYSLIHCGTAYSIPHDLHDRRIKHFEVIVDKSGNFALEVNLA